MEIVEAVGEARRSFNTERTRPLTWRLEQLEAILRLLREREFDILQAVQRDLAKPHFETFLYEVSLAKNSCLNVIKNLQKWVKPKKVCTPIGILYPSSASIVADPYGVVLVFSAWNYPFLLAIDPLVGAIAAGNAVVLKPSDDAPQTSHLLAEILPLYLDASAIKVIEGGVEESTLLLEQKWDKIFFTGNPRVGRIIMAAASVHLTPVTLELGGKNPVLVDSTVDLKATAKRIVIGKWGANNGQICIGADYILVEEEIADKLISEIRKTLEEFYGTEPHSSPDLSRIVNKKHFERVIKLLDDPKVTGKIVHGGRRDEKSLYIEPTILLDPPVDSLVMIEETFGPVLPICKVKSCEGALDIVRQKSSPLAIYVFTNDKRLKASAKKLPAGAVVFNDIALQFAHDKLPFGGVGESGMGAYHGKFSFDTFSHHKAILSRKLSPDFAFRYPPYTDYKKNVLKKILDKDYLGAIFTWSFSKR